MGRNYHDCHKMQDSSTRQDGIRESGFHVIGLLVGLINRELGLTNCGTSDCTTSSVSSGPDTPTPLVQPRGSSPYPPPCPLSGRRSVGSSETPPGRQPTTTAQWIQGEWTCTKGNNTTDASRALVT